MSDAVNLGLQLAHALEALRQLEIEWDEAKRDHKDRAERLQQEVNRIKLEILTGQKGLFQEPTPAEAVAEKIVEHMATPEFAEEAKRTFGPSATMEVNDRIPTITVQDGEIGQLGGIEVEEETFATSTETPQVRAESPSEPPSDSQPDSLYPEAVQCVLEAGKGSTTLLQKKFSIGYGRATRLIDRMEEEGIVGPADGVNPRAILKRPENSSDGEQATV